MTAFQAGVQYGDWIGGAMADDGDFNTSIRDFLQESNLITQDEFLVSIKLWNGENLNNRPVSPADGTALVIPAKTHAEALAYLQRPGPIQGREIRFSMTLEEFFRHFKRFSVALAPRGLDVVDREVDANG